MSKENTKWENEEKKTRKIRIENTEGERGRDKERKNRRRLTRASASSFFIHKSVKTHKTISSNELQSAHLLAAHLHSRIRGARSLVRSLTLHRGQCTQSFYTLLFSFFLYSFSVVHMCDGLFSFRTHILCICTFLSVSLAHIWEHANKTATK